MNGKWSTERLPAERRAVTDLVIGFVIGTLFGIAITLSFGASHPDVVCNLESTTP